MASVKNLILNFVFQTQGAGNATQDLNNLNKAQTRLGQSSASAGRAFSSQAQGLGGLVAAYAGAAATTFALQQAFDKLAQSARAIQTLEGLNTLASGLGASGTQLLESVREITKSQLTIAESAAQINLSLSAGFNTQQIERLSGVALKASRALGRDLNDAYTRVVRGSAKMETELLDELGIYTKIEPATRAYAVSIGKNVTALSEYERRQAFVNAVIEEGERKYASINTTLATTAEKLEAFGTKMIDIAMIFGMELVQRLEPIIDFFSENFPAAVALAMAAAGMLARKGIGELSNYLATATQQKLQNAIALENLIRRYTGLAPATVRASEAIGKLTASTMGLSAAEKSRFETLRETSQVRALTRAELGEISKLSDKVANSYNSQRAAIRAATITQEQNNRTIQQEFRDRQNALQALKQQQAAIRANSALTRADRQAQLQALAPTIQAAQNRVSSILPDARQSAADTKAMLDQYRALNNAKNEYTNAVRASGAAMTGWAAQSAAAIGAVGRAWSIATAGVLAFTAKLVSGLGFIISAVAIFTIAGTALAKLFGVSEELSSLFSNLLQAATRFLSGNALRSTKTALEGIATSTIGELEKVNQEFKNIDNFMFKKKFLGVDIEIEVSKEDLVRRATSAVSDIVTDDGFIRQSVSNATSSGETIGRSLVIGLLTGVGALTTFATGGLAAIAIGAGAAVGSGFLMGASETVAEQGDLNAQLNITSERVNELKTQYASVFSELNSGLDGQDIRLAAIVSKEAERIGATEILNAEQKLYLESFAQVAVSQLNQIKNLETLTTLSRALGKTSGQIAESFDISPDATKTFSILQGQLEQVAGQNELSIPVTLTLANAETGIFPELEKQLEELTARERFQLLPIDVSGDKELRAIFNNVKARINGYSDDILESIKNTGSLEGAIEELGNAWFKGGAANIAKDLRALGLTTEDVLKVLDPLSFDVLANLRNQFNEGAVASVRAADNFNTLVKQARDGGITFEQFQQGLATVDNALVSSNNSLGNLIPELKDLKDNAPTKEMADYAESLLKAATGQLETNKTIKTQLDLLAEQESYYRRLVELAAFLKTIQDSTKINFFDYEVQMNAARELESIEKSRLDILLSRARSEKTLADQAKAALASPEGRDRQGRIAEANAQQKQALSDYEQILDSVVSTLMTMRPEMVKQVSEANKLNQELEKQIANQQVQLNLVRAQAAQEEKLIALRASAASADLAVFNAEQELAAIKDQIELSSNLFSLEEKRADRAKELISSINETTQAGYDRQIEAIQAIERAESRASDTRIANIDKQIQRISGLRDLAKNVDQAITALQLSFLKAPTITKDSPDESFNVEISLRRQLLAEEISAAEQSAKNQRAILQLEAQKEISAIQSQRAQLDLELGLQQKREVLLKDQLALVKLSEQRQIDVLKAQDEARKAAASLDLANLEAQKQQTAEKYVQDFQAIEAEKQLSIKKATDDIDANIRYLESIQAQSDVFNDFLDKYGALIAAQAEVVGKQINLPARDAGEQDFNTLIRDLEAARKSVTDSYTNLFSLQAEALSISTGSSQKALDQEIAAIEARVQAEDNAFAKTIEAREAARDVTVSAAQEELDAVTQNVSLIISERARLADKIADIERNLNTELRNLSAGTAEEQIAAQTKFIDFVLGGLNDTVNAMNDAKSRYQDIVIDMSTQIRDIQAQRVDIKVQFEIDRAAFDRQMEEVRKQYEIERLQAEVKLIEAKESSGSMSAMDAAKAVNDKQQEILSAQTQLVELERRNALAALADQERIALAQAEEAQRRIRAEADLAKAKIQAEMQVLVEYGNLYQAQIESLEQYSDNSNKGTADVFNKFLGSLRGLFQSFGNGLSSALNAATGKNVAFAVEEAIAINAEEIARVEGTFTDATTSMIEWGVAAQDAIDARAREEIALEADKFLNTRSRIQQEVAATNAAFDQKLTLLETEKLIEAENAKARLKDAGKAGDKEKKKLEDLQKEYNSAIEKLKDSIVSMLTEAVNAIGSIVTKTLERKVEQAKVNEVIANENLTSVSEKLTDAQGRLQELMQNELALRDELKESYRTLAESQKEYINSLTGDDRSIKESSKVLLQNIFEQKRKQIDLSRTISERIRQDGFVQTLEDRKLTQEQRLEEATNLRLEAEKKLEETQAILTQLSSLLSGEMFKLSSSMQSFAIAVAEVQAVLSQGMSAGFGQGDIASTLMGFGNQLVSNLLFGNSGGGLLNTAINGLLKAGNTLATAGKTLNSVGSLAPTISKIPPANPFYGAGAKTAAVGGTSVLGALGSALGGGLQGFGVGNLVGLLTKDPGMGSSIGGAIGGALAAGLNVAIPAIFAKGAVLGKIAGGIGSALGVGLNFAVPVLGALIGSLIGRLFSKTPRAQNVGTISASGVDVLSTSERKVAGGTARNLGELASSGIVSLIDSLKTAGIAFKDVVTYNVKLEKDKITYAALTTRGGKFESPDVKADEAGVKKLSKFFVDSFVKGLEKGSLIVDKTIKNAQYVQEALDRFATSARDLKTLERLQEVIKASSEFDKVLDKYGKKAPATMVEAFELIRQGAEANARGMIDTINSDRRATEELFGRNSQAYRDLLAVQEDYALAQLGFVKGADGVTRTLEDAESTLKAGALLLDNIIQEVVALGDAAIAAGISLSKVNEYVNIRITENITNVLTDFGDALQSGIDAISNPAKAAVGELNAIIQQAEDRNKTASDMLEYLSSQTARLDSSVLPQAIENVAKSVELGALQVKSYLETLNEEQLKAIISSEGLIDATTKSAAAVRLAAIEESARARAAKEFAKISREFGKSLSEVTKSSAIPRFISQVTSAFEVAELLDKKSIDQFSVDFASLLNAIGRGESISENFTRGLATLRLEQESGIISQEKYVAGLRQLSEVTVDSIQVLNELITAFEDATSQINELYSASLDNLLTSTQEVGGYFSELLDGFKEKTQTVLGIFDDTLKSVAESGNRLYELRDNAQEAFDTAAKAVAEFEKSNKLTGRTSAQVAAELSSVASQIAALQGTKFDFSSFLNLSALSSRQRLLQAELSKLNGVQEEYTKLLAERTKADQDLRFARDTITTLEASSTSKLLDTRIKESELVQEVKEASLEFITSQKDLQDITQLLTAANFNLNQARFEERDRVVQVSEALKSLTTTASDLVAAVTSINSTKVEDVARQARLTAEVLYGTGATAAIEAQVKQATDSFNAVKSIATSVDAVVKSTVGVGTTFATAVTNASNTLKIYDSLLTDSFEGYTSAITGYLTNIRTILNTSFDTIDTNNFTGFTNNLTRTQQALQLINPTLAQLASNNGIGVISGITQSITDSVESFQTTILASVASLLDAFSPERKNKVDAFRESLANFDQVGASITATGGLRDALAQIRDSSGTTATNLATTTANFAALRTELSRLNNSVDPRGATVNGILTTARLQLTALGDAIQKAWDDVVFALPTTIGNNITVNTTVSAGSAFTAQDRSNFRAMVTNTRLYPRITGAPYDTQAGTIPGSVAPVGAATGGYIKGPGSDTSDSIPARLSNGEYVIKASSVRRIGKGVLDALNETGNLGASLAPLGRRGDSLVAHINSEEAMFLRQRGGSGTFNPNTGLLEFYSKDPGAFGGLFAEQEANKLFNNFNSRITSSDAGLRINSVNPGGFVRMDNATGSPQIYPWNPLEAQRLSGSNSENVMRLIANSMMMASIPRERRGLPSITGASFGLASSVANSNLNNLYLRMSDGSIRFLNSSQVGYGPDAASSAKVRGGLSSRVNQTLQLAAIASSNVTRGVNNASLSRETLTDYITDMNRDNGMFFDFYMLNAASAVNKGIRTVLLENAGIGQTRGLSGSSVGFNAGPGMLGADVRQAGIGRYRYVEPSGTGALVNPFASTNRFAGSFVPFQTEDNKTIESGLQLLPGTNFNAMFSAGGLVKRDSVAAMLEPGEFVLRKQAVDRMGIDSAIRLNSTGDVGGDIDVEVNINNNGTSQTAVGTPEVRRENGKIIVDIILEDLRNNGPIKRQIRSIR